MVFGNAKPEDPRLTGSIAKAARFIAGEGQELDPVTTEALIALGTRYPNARPDERQRLENAVLDAAKRAGKPPGRTSFMVGLLIRDLERGMSNGRG